MKNYRFGNLELKEMAKLAPLSEEKRRLHREARLAEHGWKQREIILVEGDELPEGVDEKAVRYIPKTHPFALSQQEKEEEWSEEVIKRRLNQRRGRPEKKRLEAERHLRGLRRGFVGEEETKSEKGWGEEFLPPVGCSILHHEILFYFMPKI